jgi:hypothetical protein
MRNARIDILAEMLPDAAPLLRDHGLNVIGFQPVPNEFVDTARLMIEGPSLPDACEGVDPFVAPLVWIEFTKEVYGRQSIVKITRIELVYSKDVAA